MSQRTVRAVVMLAAAVSAALLVAPSAQAAGQAAVQAAGQVCRTDPIKTAAGAVLPGVVVRTCLETSGDLRRGAIHIDNTSSTQVVTAQVNGGLMAPQYQISQCVLNVLPGNSAACTSGWALEPHPGSGLVGEVGAVINVVAFNRATGVSTSYLGVTTLLAVAGP